MQPTNARWLILIVIFSGCLNADETTNEEILQVDFRLTKDQTHNKFSSTIEPVLRVPDGAIIEVFTEEASDEQIQPDSDVDALSNLNFDLIHPLTGPVYIDGAAPGDILAVTLHEIEVGDWGWNAIVKGFSFLADSFPAMEYLQTYQLGPEMREVVFNDSMRIPLNPFPGVMGVAPADTELLSTIPPRASGGNMDDPNMTAGTTVYFPVFVEGALFSIGDGHAVQGMGEVCGTAIECPMRIVYQVEVIKERSIKEPQYETEEYYATTGFAPTLDEAARKATWYMVEYLENHCGLAKDEAYALCSLAGDLLIAEVVDLPNLLVTMHMPKSIIGLSCQVR